MRKYLLWMLAVTSIGYSLSLHKHLVKSPESKKIDGQISPILTMISPELINPRATSQSLKELENLMRLSAINPAVIDKVLTTVKCADEYRIQHNNILTLIDYSLPSSEKRLWVFDVYEKKLLFNTYVSHGIKSGALLSTYFSNKYNSKSSSIGVYKTDSSYYGRHGLSLKLNGLDPGFNDNAAGRSVVMHGGWYVDEAFINKYGRAGRSWGCPALPSNLSSLVINTIKDKSLFVVYYPSDQWFLSSKFLNCDFSPSRYALKQPLEAKPQEAPREAVFFANAGGKNKEEPILVMPADNYMQIFQTKAPLERMLRRQINDAEYIALSSSELENIAHQENKAAFSALYFVIPVIKSIKGYYGTEMNFVDLGRVKSIRLSVEPLNSLETRKSFTVDFEEPKPSIKLHSSNNFIRWLGL